jgi:hypothetical protein
MLHAQVETLRGFINEYEDKNRKLKKIMSEELISALLLRFERNEEGIRKMDEKLEMLHLEMKEKLLKEIRDIRDEVSDARLSKAITTLMSEKEIKVDSKPLNEFKKDY